MPEARQEHRGRVIECSPGAIQAVHAAVLAGYFQLVRGGLEVGGVLFGRLEGGTLQVLDARPIASEYGRGHAFSVSQKDHAAVTMLLRAPLREPGLWGLVPVGWYRSHTQGGLELSESDVALHTHWFPEQWQVVLVLRPEWKKPTRAAFYVRDAAGSLVQAPEFVADPHAGIHRTILLSTPAPVLAPARAPVVEPPAAVASSMPGEEPVSSAEAVPLFSTGDYAAQTRRKRISGWWVVAAIATAGVVMGVVAGIGIRNKWFVTPVTLQITLKDNAGQLAVHWDKQAPAIRRAERATLEIRDGEEQRVLHLSGSDLRGVDVVVGRRSGRVAVTLRADLPGGRIAEGRATLVGDPVPPPP